MASTAYLLVSLLIPWLSGYSLLRLAESRAPYLPNPCLQIAFGFFFGHSLLQLLVHVADALLGYIPVPGVNVTLVLIAVCACLVSRIKRITTRPAERREAFITRRSIGPVFWVFFLLTAVHLSLAVIEVLHRPVFPWDAWLSWMYRAKAWFFSGSVVPMDAPQDWLKGTGSAVYNAAGAHYPTLVPITAAWTALHLGFWSETLVNVPVIACGLALAIGVYGLAREAGRSPGTGMIAAYLVLSIPLIGTHLSLAGQADIWMAGYAGLGLGACLLGLAKGSSSLFWRGILLTVLSIGVKAEGGVWLLVALGTGAVIWFARGRWAYLLPIPVIVLLLWISGIHFAEFTVLGSIGLTDNTLHASFLGSHELQHHDVLDDYWQNFFLGGSWHLLWPMLLLATLGVLRAGDSRRRLAILAFLGTAVASQVIIFGFTDQGRWAEDWTAINRIPMHLAPALVLCLILPWPSGDQLAGKPAFRVIAAAVAAAFLMACTIATAYLGLGFTAESGNRVATPAANHQLVMGEGKLKQGERHLTGFENNVAIVSSGAVQINADSASVLQIQTSGDNTNGQNFFWRTANDPENLKTLQYEGRGTTYLRLREHAEWTGDITEFGVVFFDDGGSLAVGDIAIQPDSLLTRVRQTFTEWTRLTPWSQKSTHWLPAGAAENLLPLPLFVTGWMLLSLLIIALAVRSGDRNGLPSAFVVCLLAWMLLDARWLINQGVNTRNTLTEHTPGNSQPLRFSGDEIVRQVVNQAQRHLGDSGQTLVITADDPRMRYQMFRAKYHALPQPAYVHEGPRGRLRGIDRLEYLLVLKQPYRDPSAPPTTAEEWQAFLASRNDKSYRVLWESGDGFLLRQLPYTRAGFPR